MTPVKKLTVRAARSLFGAGLTLVLVAEAGAAIDLSSAQHLTGQWDLSLANTNRKCRIMLRPEVVAGGNALAMPAGCRRAMPLLASVGAWSAPNDQAIDLQTVDGRTVLEFQPAGGEALAALSPEGDNYQMVAVNGARLAQATKPTPIPAAPPAAAANGPVVAQAKPPLPAAVALKPNEIAGRYNIFRSGAKDTGCMLTLDDKAPGQNGHKAQLAPACRDQGMVIFDPRGWSLEKGRLVLTARKGHQTHLDLQPDGMWMKDPKEGAALAIKKF